MAPARQDGEQVRQCLGGMLVAPSPALMTGMRESAARMGAPSGDGAWRQCPRSRRRYEWYRPRFRHETLDTLALGKPSTLPPRLSIAASNERRVRVLACKTEWQAFAFAAFRVGSRLTADIFAQPRRSLSNSSTVKSSGRSNGAYTFPPESLAHGSRARLAAGRAVTRHASRPHLASGQTCLPCSGTFLDIAAPGGGYEAFSYLNTPQHALLFLCP